jgi:hypothetical protein
MPACVLTTGTGLYCESFKPQQTITFRCKFQHAYLNALSERWNVSGEKDRCKFAHLHDSQRAWTHAPKLLNFQTHSVPLNLVVHLFMMVHSAQTPEEKTFWASLSDSANAESVLVQMSV